MITKEPRVIVQGPGSPCHFEQFWEIFGLYFLHTLVKIILLRPLIRYMSPSPHLEAGIHFFSFSLFLFFYILNSDTPRDTPLTLSFNRPHLFSFSQSGALSSTNLQAGRHISINLTNEGTGKSSYAKIWFYQQLISF